MLLISLNFGRDAIWVVSWSTWERRNGRVPTAVSLPVAYCRFNSKVQPDVEQNCLEIKTACAAGRFKAKQDFWLTVMWHVRCWNYESLLRAPHSPSCCTYIIQQEDPLWSTMCRLLISTHQTSSLPHWALSSAFNAALLTSSCLSLMS